MAWSQTSSASTSGVTSVNGLTGAVTVSGGTPRVLLPLDPVTAAAASGGEWEVDPDDEYSIRLKPIQWADVADANAAVPTTWTKNNFGAMVASVASSRFIMSPTGSGTYGSGVATAPFLSRSLPTPDVDWVEWVLRLDTTTLSGAVVKWGLTSDIAGRLAFQISIDTLGSNSHRIRLTHSDTTVVTLASSIADATALAGIWVRVRLYPVSSSLNVDYNLTSGGTSAPTVWTSSGAGRVVLSNTTGGSLALTAGLANWREFLAWHANGGTPTAGFIMSSVRYGSWVSGGAGPLLTGGFTASTAALIIAEPDMGSAGGVIDMTTLRLWLAALLEGDATATFSLTVSDTSLAACTEATTYQSAATLQAKDPGSDTEQTSARRYGRLRVKVTSTASIQHLTLRLAALRIPTAAT